MPSLSCLPGQIAKFIKLALVLAGCNFILAFLSPGVGHAHHLLPVHELNCSKDFPCPKPLHRRIDFWIQVFKRWNKELAIFHDPGVPERVYSVVDTGDGCGRSVKRKLKRERNRIKKLLSGVAAKVESGNVISVADEIHFVELFPNRNPNRIRLAGDKIRCQSGVKDSFLRGLQRFSRYSYLVDTVLAQYKLPQDIRYLPFVESSYNPTAYSKAGAAGMWQIMPSTARTLGLELNATIDERLDPEAATHGAARYLVKSQKSLTELARSIDPRITREEISPFVITSYNYGLNGMRRAINQIKPDYLSVLQNYKSPNFQVAVKNFYSSFLAARHVAINSNKYFGNVAEDDEVRYQTLVLKNSTSIERIKTIFGVYELDLKPLNLGLTRFIWHGWRMIPAGYQLKLPYKSDGYKTSLARFDALAPESVASGSDNYTVRRGDTACAVARALRVNCRELITINRLGKKAVIRIGQELVIPRKLVVVADVSSKGPDKIVVIQGEPIEEKIYQVKRGDTACGIAERFNVGCRKLISINQLGRKARIYVGQKLIISSTSLISGQIVGLDENNLYLVRKGDFACSIASRYSVSCSKLKKINQLNNRATIYPGQKLVIPGLVVPDTTETAEQLAQIDQTVTQSEDEQSESQMQSQTQESDQDDMVENSALSNLLDALPDLSVSVADSNGSPVYRIWIEADETLGHYSDWLGLRSTKDIRQLNNIKSIITLRIGRRLKLPINSGDMVETFEQKRIEYHQVLSESLKEHYELSGIDRYSVKSGDSVWSLSNELGFPIWLFYRLNPSLKLSGLAINQEILLPKLQQK